MTELLVSALCWVYAFGFCPATLTWDPSPDSQVRFYMIYRSTDRAICEDRAQPLPGEPYATTARTVYLDKEGRIPFVCYEVSAMGAGQESKRSDRQVVDRREQ